MTTALIKPDSATAAESGAGNLPIQVETLSPADYARWDQYVATSSQGTFFHTTAWMKAVRDAFHHEPVYLLARRGQQVTGVLPLFLVRSWIAGTMLVSVPYAVYGGVVASDRESSDVLVDQARQQMHARKATFIDLRSIHAACDDVDLNTSYVTFQRELPDQPEDVLSWIPRKARAAARSARDKHGLTVSFGDEHLREVWSLYCRSMHRLASLNYPFSFFKALLDQTPGSHSVSLIRHQHQPVGGLVTLYYQEKVLPYFVGCDERFNRFGVNNYIYLTIMEEAVRRGCRVFDFGRTRIANKGSFDFKRFHGFEPTPLEYQRITLPGASQPDLTPSNPKFRLARSLWSRLPRPLTRRMGTILSKHIPG